MTVYRSCGYDSSLAMVAAMHLLDEITLVVRRSIVPRIIFSITKLYFTAVFRFSIYNSRVRSKHLHEHTHTQVVLLQKNGSSILYGSIFRIVTTPCKLNSFSILNGFFAFVSSILLFIVRGVVPPHVLQLSNISIFSLE